MSAFLNDNGLAYLWSKLKTLLAGKQDKLTFDTTPKSGSANPVTSAGVATALGGKANNSHTQGHDTVYLSAVANASGNVTFLDRGFLDMAGACRTAFMPANAIAVEYTQDNGATWSTYSLTDIQKQGIFSINRGYAVKLGGPSATAQTVGHGVRITVSPTDRYTTADLFYCWFSSSGSQTKCNIERSTIGAKNTFTTIRNNVPVSGWSGPNTITFTAGTFGGGVSQTSNFYAYRFTFITSAVHATSTGVPTVTDLRMYGASCWTYTNQMTFNGHLYNWDVNKNAIFPANLTATTIAGVNPTKIGYLSNVTSDIQTQLNVKATTQYVDNAITSAIGNAIGGSY